MKCYSQYRIHDLFELQESLSGLSKSNRWVKLADRLPWAKIEKEYNKRLRNIHCGAGNKPARMVVGALIVKHVESLSDEKIIQVELYRKRFGMLPREVQVDKIYLGKANRQYLKDNNVECYNRSLGRSPKEDNDRHAEEKRRAICERNKIEATFGTFKRVCRANDIRAKLDNTADTWIGACFFTKNVMKFLRGLLCLVFAKIGLEALKKRVLSGIDDLVGVLPSSQVSWGRINQRDLKILIS